MANESFQVGMDYLMSRNRFFGFAESKVAFKSVAVSSAFVVSLMLTGCSISSDGDSSSTERQGSNNETQESNTPKGVNPTLKPDPTSEECSDLTGDEAFSASIGKVPAVFDWNAVDISTYDPCSPLSWIQLMQQGANSRSAEQLMLFNRGEYLGTATEEPLNGMSNVTRLDEYTISVSQPRSNRVDQFRWDDAAQRVVMNNGDSDDLDASSNSRSHPPAAGHNPDQIGGTCGVMDGATVTASSNTSCGFAMNVAQEALQPIYTSPGSSDPSVTPVPGVATVTAVSPSTGGSISMRCRIGTDGSTSTCNGGENAEVSITVRSGNLLHLVTD